MQAFDRIGNELALVAKTTIETLLKGSDLAYNKRSLYYEWAKSAIIQIHAIAAGLYDDAPNLQ